MSITLRIHLFPFRTQKLSSAVLKILGGKLPGKIGRCRHKYSSLAQLVEHAAVNRRVVGSSPTGGARKETSKTASLLCLVRNNQRHCGSAGARSRPPPVAEGGRRRALSKREKCERKRAVRPFCKLDRWFESNRGSHVGAKFALLRFCFFPKKQNYPHATLLLLVSQKTQDVFCESGSETNDTAVPQGPEADRRRWRREGGEGRLAKGRNASGSEQSDHFASWTKAGKSEEMESRPPPVAEGGEGRLAKGRNIAHGQE